ncbi:MAG: phenylacetate--CoA ligase family protein [Rhodoferax sp.]|uniref:phenylacetate--CoA ligase family protein n=1 Tax=Rhodoferax sp. TaxID=50421 RepID=UPI00260A22FA|nr:phenylacetate--CoA ligase family protein [Rhodoferax sp.]MDD2879229.1 phenylacetate--CoA ligase family protein [Rhodoferax sp.]
MMPIFDLLRFSSVSMDVLAYGHATAQTLAARQKSRLDTLLDVARRDSRFYREHLRGATTGNTPLSCLPPVSRRELMNHFDDWVTDPQLKLSELRAFTADPQRIGEPYLGKYLVWESSGTSHIPGIFVQDAQAMVVYDALEALRRSAPRPLQRWFDPLSMTERIAFVGAISGHFASFVSMQRLRALNPWLAPSVRSFSILQPTRSLVDELNAFAPTVIATYPTVATLLADEAARGVLRFTPREIWTGGETLSAAARLWLEHTLGCAVRNSYGASEFMSIAWECDQRRLHVNSDWVILEPVDQRGRPVPEGRLSYTTLLTNLANHVQPLIRYDLGDQVLLRHEPCACGSSLPVIEVQGRRDDPLVMAGLGGQPVTLLPLALTTVLEDLAGVFDFHVRQRDDHTLVLRLAMQGEEGAAAMARCCTVLKSFAVAQELKPICVLSELGQAIPRGRSGKAQRIVACPSQRSPER